MAGLAEVGVEREAQPVRELAPSAAAVSWNPSHLSDWGEETEALAEHSVYVSFFFLEKKHQLRNRTVAAGGEGESRTGWTWDGMSDEFDPNNIGR